MKKIITMIIAAAIMLVNAVMPVYAAETVDYTAQLAELRTLMDQCSEQGIPTDYELVSYTTIERFQTYINEDLAKGVDSACTDYEKACIDDLYAETKASLEAYLDGGKKAFVVKRPDMNNLSQNGKYIYDGTNPVFSIGYCGFDLAKADISDFQNFGVNNIQLEIGPTHTYNNATDGWGKEITCDNSVGWANVVNEDKYRGTSSLKIEYVSSQEHLKYLRYYQSFDCMPNTTYKFGCWSKGSTVNGTWMTLHPDWEQRNYLTASDDWKYNEFTYTTGSNETTITLTLLSENITAVYLDDFFVYELDGAGNADGQNFVANSGLEGVAYPAIEDLKRHLRDADRYNVAVSLLLSPHYFPTGLSSDIYTDKGTFIHYNINHPTAKAIVEEHMRAVLSEVKDYDAIESICLSNEPWFDTRWFESYYTPLFVEYLYQKYNSLENINTAHGKNYSSDNDITMPANNTILGQTYLSTDAVAYDWIKFNDKVFADWHKWMADIVEEYLPNTPVHAKVMENLSHGEGRTRDELCRGTDFETFGEFSDYSGCDGGNYTDDEYYEMMFLYDYLQSVVEKPIYNVETHIIKDYDGSSVDAFSPDTTKKVLKNMWQGAVHGRSMSSLWLWGREYPDAEINSEFWGSILFRPDLVDGLGKMNLNLTRLADELVELQTYSDKVAVYYSKPSRLYNETYTQAMFAVYEDALENGYDVGVVTEDSISTLSKYDTLIIPDGAIYTTQAALTAIQSFAASGGKVLCGSNKVLTKNELNKNMSPDINGAVIYSDGELSENLPEKEIRLIDVGTEKNTEHIDWQYSITEDRILINAVNMFGSDSIIAADVYYNGQRLTNMTELISGTNGIDRLVLNGYEPMLLEYKLDQGSVSGEAEIQNLTFDGSYNKLYWECAGEGYVSTKIYKYNTDGTVQFLADTEYDTYQYSAPGTYIVRPVLSDGTELEGKVITTVAAKNSARISKIEAATGSYKIGVDNITGNYLRCKVIVKFLDEADTVIKYAYSKSFIAPGKGNEFKLSMKQPAGFKRAIAYVYDDLDNCLASQEIALN